MSEYRELRTISLDFRRISSNLLSSDDGNAEVNLQRLMDYIEKTQKRTLKHIKSGEFDDAEQYMTIDANARRTLELMSSSGGSDLT